MDNLDFELEEVSSIDIKHYTGKVYDLRVEDNETYVVNDYLVHNCESFLYFSWAYKSWKNDYGLQKETRAPKRNNVNLNGGACKHCLSVLELINRSNTLFDKIAKDLNTLFQHYKKQDITQKEIERLQNELKNMKAPDLKSQANNNNITGTNN